MLLAVLITHPIILCPLHGTLFLGLPHPTQLIIPSFFPGFHAGVLPHLALASVKRHRHDLVGSRLYPCPKPVYSESWPSTPFIFPPASTWEQLPPSGVHHHPLSSTYCWNASRLMTRPRRSASRRWLPSHASCWGRER